MLHSKNQMASSGIQTRLAAPPATRRKSTRPPERSTRAH